MSQKSYYISTTLPYVNADPHIGFSTEILRADLLARYYRELGYDVCFNTGTDEHGLKIHRKAKEQKRDPQDYCDEYATKFDQLKKVLNLSYDKFIRTTDKHHKKAAQHFWNLCKQNDDIYKKTYQVKYCVGCELEKTDSELDNGKCPLHPNQEIELINEENYFFKFSKYQDKLLKLYNDNPDFVLPDYRQKEIKTFVENGLQDFSISRLKSKMPWGIEVPDDPDHVMYVWFDALINYISTLGWPEDKAGEFKKYWPFTQVAGKDNLRQQTAMWQAMLMSAGIANSKQVLVFGFITSNGQKMSKSLGNVVNPIDLVKKYGTDPVRYYTFADFNTFDDNDFSDEKFIKRYNSDLANGLGNLVQRVSKLCERNLIKTENSSLNNQLNKKVSEHIEKFEFHIALEHIWKMIQDADKLIDEKKPWTLQGADVHAVLMPLIHHIKIIAINLKPFMPETSEKILNIFDGEIKAPSKPLFPRLI